MTKRHALTKHLFYCVGEGLSHRPRGLSCIISMQIEVPSRGPYILFVSSLSVCQTWGPNSLRQEIVDVADIKNWRTSTKVLCLWSQLRWGFVIGHSDPSTASITPEEAQRFEGSHGDAKPLINCCIYIASKTEKTLCNKGPYY